MEWFVSREGSTFGPFSFDDLLSAARDERLKKTDHIWSTGMQEWVSAASVPGIWIPPQPTTIASVANTPPAKPKVQLAVTEDSGGELEETNVKGPSFFIRYWKGDVSLPKSYWLVGVGVMLFVTAFSNVFGAVVPTLSLTHQQVGVAFTAFLLVLLASVLWQVVGLWRSAGKYIKQSKTPGWGWAARVIVVLSIIRVSVDFNELIQPMLAESMKLAVGVDDVPANHMRLMNNATELEISGGMPFGTADAFEKLLDAAPTVKVVHLNSLGGRIDEGYKINQIIRGKGLATYSSSACVSACTIAFLGGNPRLLGNDARLGFHSGNFGGLDERSIPAINQSMRKTFEEMNIPLWFTNKAMATSATDMWYPASSELLSAGIISKVVDSKTFAMSGIGDWQSVDAAEKALSAIPLYATLRANDPNVYKLLVSKFADSVREGKTALDMQNEVHAIFVDQILPKYLKSAPDNSLIKYWSSQLDEMKGLAAVDPKYCVQFLFPVTRDANFDLTRLLPQELQKQDVYSLAQLIEAAARSPVQNVASEDDFKSIVAPIAVSHPEIGPFLSEPQKHYAEPQKLCGAFIAFYDAILALPPQRSGPILRLMTQ